jgi:hypothetical protein
MIAVGVDVHKRQCSLAMQFEDGELASFAPFENRREGWLELLAVLPPEAEIALEVSVPPQLKMECPAVRLATTERTHEQPCAQAPHP